MPGDVRPLPSTWLESMGNEDVAENQSAGVALRKGHIGKHLRLVEPPKGYRGETPPIERLHEENFDEIALRRAYSR